jgi:hypothetical protein
MVDNVLNVMIKLLIVSLVNLQLHHLYVWAVVLATIFQVLVMHVYHVLLIVKFVQTSLHALYAKSAIS